MAKRDTEGVAAVVGRNVMRVREARGWPKSKLARMADLNPASVTLLESGQRNASIATIVKIAEVLGVDPADLLPSLPRSDVGVGRVSPTEPFPEDLEGLNLNALEDLGRRLMREHRAAIEAGDLERAGDVYRRRVALWQQIKELNPPDYRITVKADGPVEVLFFREPTESELADLEARYPGYIEVRDLVPAL